VRQVLEHLDLGEGQVAGEQRHHLDVRPVRGVGRHRHGHHAGALAAHCPVATAVGHCGWGGGKCASVKLVHNIEH